MVTVFIGLRQLDKLRWEVSLEAPPLKEGGTIHFTALVFSSHSDIGSARSFLVRTGTLARYCHRGIYLRLSVYLLRRGDGFGIH
jgi:hypothetical protein